MNQYLFWISIVSLLLPMVAIVLSIIQFIKVIKNSEMNIAEFKKELNDAQYNISMLQKLYEPTCVSVHSSKNNTEYTKESVCGGSILVDKQLRAEKLFIEGTFDEKNIEAVSYNLTVESISRWIIKRDDDKTIEESDIEIVSNSSMVIHPREMVFVTSKEVINMPPNIVGRVMTRNTYIRTGLLISAPLYQPGHITKITYSVYNMSDYDIKIAQGDSIAHIFFEALGEAPENKYGTATDQYQNEYSFKFPKDIKKHIEEQPDIEKKMNNLEAKIYTIIAAFMGAFVSVLSLLVINFNALSGKSVNEIIAIDISLAICITLILAIVLLFVCMLTRRKQDKRHKNKREK